jgi:hypothetical protein
MRWRSAPEPLRSTYVAGLAATVAWFGSTYIVGLDRWLTLLPEVPLILTGAFVLFNTRGAREFLTLRLGGRWKAVMAGLHALVVGLTLLLVTVTWPVQ